MQFNVSSGLLRDLYCDSAHLLHAQGWTKRSNGNRGWKLFSQPCSVLGESRALPAAAQGCRILPCFLPGVLVRMPGALAVLQNWGWHFTREAIGVPVPGLPRVRKDSSCLSVQMARCLLVGLVTQSSSEINRCQTEEISTELNLFRTNILLTFVLRWQSAATRSRWLSLAYHFVTCSLCWGDSGASSALTAAPPSLDERRALPAKLLPAAAASAGRRLMAHLAQEARTSQGQCGKCSMHY